jgi:hypothetical protein
MLIVGPGVPLDSAERTDTKLTYMSRLAVDRFDGAQEGFDYIG